MTKISMDIDWEPLHLRVRSAYLWYSKEIQASAMFNAKNARYCIWNVIGFNRNFATKLSLEYVPTIAVS